MNNVNSNTGILNTLLDSIHNCTPITQTGLVTRVTGLLVESLGPNVSVGNICKIKTRYPGLEKAAEVVGINENKILLMPFEDTNGIGIGCIVETAGEMLQVPVGMGLLGRVVDGFGQPLDGKGPIKPDTTGYLHSSPPPALSRPRISRPLATGIRSIDSLITVGEGQRVGIFAGSGVGKSVSLGMIARNSEADVNVIALIGERGREVKEFIDGILGEAGLRRSVVVVVTSDQAAVLRIRGAQTATTIAEFFRNQGKRVILMMDSVTRVAMAQREIGLAIGEPPTTKGYTPSVYALLPRLLERAGMASKGSITGFYTVLVESDDMNDPVADTVRSILDGHMVLSRRLAEQNHYPAVDILQSVSRVMNDIIDEKHLAAVVKTRDVLATYQEAEDLINIGAYVKGNNPKIDFAIGHIDKVRTFLRQKQYEQAEYKQSVTMLRSIFQL